MRYAIFSDVHANLDALRAVLEDIQAQTEQTGRRVDQYWCLGDVVGYGPQPRECLSLVRSRCTLVIPGNHDWAAVGKLDLDDFSATAAEAALWTRQRLDPSDVKFLQALPPDGVTVGNFTLAHGSPSNPIWEYLTTPDTAGPNFAFFDTHFCMVGHTHLPTIFLQPVLDHDAPRRAALRSFERKGKVALAMATPGGPSRKSLESGEYAITLNRVPITAPCDRWNPVPGFWRLPHNYRAIINPGSVGQPRDGDPRAAYVIFDSELGGFEFRRVPYNIPQTQRKIQACGLPPQVAEQLAERLATGN